MASALSYRNKNSDSSDSDSENSDKECLNWKRVTKNDDVNIEKIPIAPPPVEPQPTQIGNPLKRKRNTIWSEVLEDQMMSDTLKFCGIKNKPKGFGNRGEESYDFTAGKEDFNDDGSDENMSDDSRTHYPYQKRFKRDTYVEIDDVGKETARKIVRVLAEQKQYLIFRVVKYLGTEKALEFLKRTEEVEEKGGLMIKNNARRRTPGGVYLYLVRSDNSIEKEIMDKIFEGELNSYEKKKKFDDIRKKKSKKGKKKKKKSKDKMEVQNSSPVNSSPVSSKDSDVKNMEEDNVITDTADTSVDNIPDTIVDDIPNGIASERTSDLEEGEVE